MPPDTPWDSWPVYGLGDPLVGAASSVTWETGALNNAVGNGTALFRHRRAGGVVTFNLFMLFGSTSVFGGSGSWAFINLPQVFNVPGPVAAVASTTGCASAWVFDNDGSSYPGVALLNAGSGAASSISGLTIGSGGIMTSTSPFTWAANDTLIVSGSAEAFGA